MERLFRNEQKQKIFAGNLFGVVYDSIVLSIPSLIVCDDARVVVFEY